MELASVSAPEAAQSQEAIPGIAGELLTAYNAQDLSIRNKQQLIKSTIEEVARENVRCRELDSELASLNRKIYCVVEENKAYEAKCAELWEYLNQAVKTKLEYTHRMSDLNQQLQQGKRTYEKYAASIEEYEKNSEIVEKKSSEYQQLEEKRAELESICDEIESKEALCLDERIEELRRITAAEQEEKRELENRKSQLNEKIEELRTEVDSIEREKDIYEKRNKAQLFRMQRQLQENNLGLEKQTDQLKQLTLQRDQLLGNSHQATNS